MEKKEMRQSSLPRSLIPHLYSGPQYGDISPTTGLPLSLPLPFSVREAAANYRTELPPMRNAFLLPPLPSVDAPRGLRSLNHETRPLPSDFHTIYPTIGPTDFPTPGLDQFIGNLPSLSHSSSQRHHSTNHSDLQYHLNRHEPEETFYASESQNYALPHLPEAEQFRNWQEGEAGPSSLIHTSNETGSSRGRRGSSHRAQHIKRESHNYREDIQDSEGFRGSTSYSGSMGYSDSTPAHPYSSWPETYQESEPRISRLESDLGPRMSVDPPQFPLTSVNASQGGWVGVGYRDQPSGYSQSSVSEEGSSGGRPEDEGDEAYTAVPKGKKRRRDSEAVDDDTRKNRKTAVACNFCRGRKLRCDGGKPSCSNCMARHFQCEYVPVQRRRGPGKAPKGTKSKKGPTTGRLEASISRPLDRASGVIGEASVGVDNRNAPGRERSPRRRNRRRRTDRTRSASVNSESIYGESSRKSEPS